ncbi:HTH_Tnp_Tc3_2 domain-containing protein [Trichonephila clavipes]|nr:HTH_Tnp_Tc3_2 domain-containing protein [Trichonephila clavipes]
MAKRAVTCSRQIGGNDAKRTALNVRHWCLHNCPQIMKTPRQPLYLPSRTYLGILPQKWSGTEPNRTVNCIVFKAMANDRLNKPTLCHEEFCRPRSVTVKQTARGGRVRSTTPAEDRYIVLSAKRNRRTTAQQVANQFLAASGKQISRKTVARRLRGGGLYARRPVVCVPLTRQHRTVHLQWCREHHNWIEQDWACVLFSNESRFSLSSDCRRQLIWRESGTAYRPENIQERTDIRHAVSWCGPAS